MDFKKTGIVFALFIIGVLTPLVAPAISDGLNYVLLQPVFNDQIHSFYLNYFTYTLAACLCAFLMWKFRIRKWAILLILFAMITVSIFININLFHQYQQHPEDVDIKGLPDCMFEHNYKTYWEFLTKGCHLSVYDVVKTLLYKSAYWVGVIYISDFLFRKIRRRRQQAAHDQIIDN